MDGQAEAERAAGRTKTDRHMGKRPRCGGGCVLGLGLGVPPGLQLQVPPTETHLLLDVIP